MLFSFLVQNLQSYLPEKVTEDLQFNHFVAYKRLEKGQTLFSARFLYIGLVSELPPAPPDAVPFLLCIQDVPLVERTAWETAARNFCLLPADTNLTGILNQIADLFVEEGLYQSALQQLYEVLCSNNGLQQLVNVATRYFENPIFINDIAYKLLAMSQNMTFQNETIEAQKTLGYIHEENIREMNLDQIWPLLSKSGDIIFSSRKSRNERWLFKSVELQGHVVAGIALVDAVRPFNVTDYRLLQQFSQIVAVEISKAPFYMENPGILYNYLLADLLNGEITDPGILLQRSSYVSLKLYQWFQIIVVHIEQSSHNAPTFQWLGAELRLIIPDCRWTVYENTFVLFISRPHSSILTEKETHTLETFAQMNSLVIGIGESYTHPKDSPKYYHEALHAAETAVLLQKGPGIYHYSDMMPYYAANLLLKNNGIEDFSHPAVAQLQEYDALHDTQLLETLRLYLSLGGNSAATAKALYLHRNTLSYRLRKIIEVTGIDLNDGNERLKLQLHFTLLEYQEPAEKDR